MSNEEMNKYDQLIDSKAAGMQFEFKEAYWTEMEALLDQKERKKGFFWWIFSAGAFAVIAGTFFLMNGNSKTINTSNASQHQSARVANINSSLLEDKKTSFVAVPTDKANQSNIVSKNNTNEIAEKGTATSVRRVAMNEQSDTNEKGIAPSQISTAKQVQTVRKENTALAKSANSGLLVQQKKTQIFAQKTTSAESVKNAMVVSNSAKKEGSASIIAPWNDIHMSVLPINTLSAKNQATVGKKISTLNTRIHTEHTLSLQAGFGYTANSFSKNNFGGEKIHFGLLYTLQKGLFGFETGILASWNSLKGLDYVQRTRIYGFTSSTVTSQLNYQSNIQLNIPIEAKLNVKRHSIGLGAQCNILLTTLAKSKQWDETSMQNGIEYGYRAGISPIFLSGILDYSYRISTRFSIGAKFSYGLTSFLSKERANLNTQHPNLFSGQVVLNYKLNYFTK